MLFKYKYLPVVFEEAYTLTIKQIDKKVKVIKIIFFVNPPPIDLNFYSYAYTKTK